MNGSDQIRSLWVISAKEEAGFLFVEGETRDNMEFIQNLYNLGERRF